MNTRTPSYYEKFGSGNLVNDLLKAKILEVVI